MNPSDTLRKTPSDPQVTQRLPCDEIQALMLEYMQRDLGEGRSDVIREHTRRCAVCRDRLAELQKTLGLLGAADPDNPAAHLSERHRARLARALMHPVLDWVYVHHILVSALIATLVLTMVVFGLRRYRVWQEGLTGPGISVTILDEDVISDP